MRNLHKIFIIASILLTGCSTTHDPSARGRLKEENLLGPAMTKKLITGQAKAPRTEDVKTELNTQISGWWYGHGVGKTATNVGAIVVFPPWALYLLANAGISLAGYEPAYITDALPPKTRLGVLGMYDSITSVPGRVNAGIAGKPFYSSPSVNSEEVSSIEPEADTFYASQQEEDLNEKDRESRNRR